ncbi:metallophosphoesterase [Nitrospirillum viridazoti]|uniref:Metallophosphoesterase n=1 Tax=Nitrospirillum viridazoti CBAmc TaxID=1441467 RepID=A0A248K3D5_9PROT|nr:metallophosphoesterase [Nitrospirillum amazonense]ASG24938.1 metallophosphoesterase [Nitrospirillum amazonense CBAmc]TWB29989.1 serine/threonine protein phosphatase 1 [Nitrospirillum amazonense]
MLNRLRAALRPAQARPDRTAPRAPDGHVLYAVGDVHGELGLLRRLLDAIARDHAQMVERHGPLTPVLIMLGDYVDRGPDSRGVVDLLRGGADPAGRTLDDMLPGFTRHCLRGNHEQSMLDFLDDPMAALRWLDFGGPATLRSYGLPAVMEGPAVLQAVALSEALAAQLPPSHRRFLDDLTYQVVYGDYAFVHAGIRPGRPLAEQTAEDMLWIRAPFMLAEGPHEKVIVHGHTIVPDVDILPQRIAVDTGAYRSGRLSAVVLHGPDIRVLDAQRAGPL